MAMKREKKIEALALTGDQKALKLQAEQQLIKKSKMPGSNVEIIQVFDLFIEAYKFYINKFMVCYVIVGCTHNILNSFFFREINYYYKMYIVFLNLNSFLFYFFKLALIITSSLIKIMFLFMLYSTIYRVMTRNLEKLQRHFLVSFRT